MYVRAAVITEILQTHARSHLALRTTAVKVSRVIIVEPTFFLLVVFYVVPLRFIVFSQLFFRRSLYLCCAFLYTLTVSLSLTQLLPPLFSLPLSTSIPVRRPDPSLQPCRARGVGGLCYSCLACPKSLARQRRAAGSTPLPPSALPRPRPTLPHPWPQPLSLFFFTTALTATTPLLLQVAAEEEEQGR